MPDESVDAIVTDPPYGINYISQTGAKIKNDQAPFIWFLYDAFRVLRPGSSIICFTRWDVGADLHRRDEAGGVPGQK